VEFSGRSVASAGDVNGDGFDDLIIGAASADTNGSDSGSSYVVFGKASGFTSVLNLSSLDGNTGFRIDGVNAIDQSGSSVSSAGDVNGDGFDDLLVGANRADPNGSTSGSSYVVFGSRALVDVVREGTEASNRINGGFGDDVIYGLSGSDTLIGWEGVDALYGGSGNDNLRGGAGADALNGGSGSDFASYFNDAAIKVSLDGSIAGTGAAAGDIFTFIENLSGSDTGNDQMSGNAAANRLNGNGGKDTLFGRDGADVLKGGLGNDILSGGSGADQFVFDTALSATTNKDTITGLSSIDKIVLDNDIFTALGNSFTSSEFRAINTGTSFASVDASDNIIYLKSTGQFFYDRDGSATTFSRVLFAEIPDNTIVDFGNFLMIE
jgi:Ca2+-binding RTX toxin-like protein